MDLFQKMVTRLKPVLYYADCFTGETHGPQLDQPEFEWQHGVIHF